MGRTGPDLAGISDDLLPILVSRITTMLSSHSFVDTLLPWVEQIAKRATRLVKESVLTESSVVKLRGEIGKIAGSSTGCTPNSGLAAQLYSSLHIGE